MLGHKQKQTSAAGRRQRPISNAKNPRLPIRQHIVDLKNAQKARQHIGNEVDHEVADHVCDEIAPPKIKRG